MAGGITGDAYVHKRTIINLSDRKAAVENAKNQQITGRKYLRDRDLGERVVFANSLKRDIALQTGFVAQNRSSVKLRLGEEERVVRALQNVAERYKTELILFNDGTVKDPTSFLVGFNQHLTTIEREGNSTVGDGYIFGGTITNEPPFKIANLLDGLDPATGEITAYYNGNQITTDVAIDTRENLTFDLLGTHPGFEKLIRSLKIANNPSITSGDERVIKAQELVDEAINELAGLISKIGSQDKGMDELIESQEDRLLYLSAKHEEIVGVDEMEAANTFMVEQRILSLSYAMMAKLNEMSMVDYFK